MKNLNLLNCSDIAEFDLIKNSKDNIAALTVLRPQVLNHYNNYQLNFSNIHTIGNAGFTVAENVDLLKCYKGTTNALLALIGKITKSQTTEFQYICAYCLYHTVSTVDHYIPKDEYPVFCVMARNLLPGCANCNSTKNNYWRGSGERWFLHFYNDVIPNLPFLTGLLSFNNNLPTVSYQLAQSPGIGNNMFALIQTHFTRLGLLELYKQGINVVMAEIKKSVNTARTVQPALTTVQINQVLINYSSNLKINYGNNYWQAVAIDLLANSQPFLQSL